MDIRMVDLHTQYLRIKTEIDAAINNVLSLGNFIQGREVGEFERSLSEYLGGVNVVSCGNGTDAIQIALMALDLEPGDEVIVPSYTYVATAEALALLRLRPVFIDVHPDTFVADISQIENILTKRTKAIVPVHLYGQCCDMEPLLQIAEAHGLHVVEDAAQALGAEYIFSDNTSKKSGTLGTIGTTSFFPTKNLGCYGDGGAIFCSNPALEEKIRMIANHGQRVKYQHELVGVNSRLDTIQAAILKVKLSYLDQYMISRRKIAEYYDLGLAGMGNIDLPARCRHSTHVFHQYTIRIDRRDELRRYLAKNGIQTMIYYPTPLHLQVPYRSKNSPKGSLPVSERLSKTVLSLPIHTEITDAELAFICQTIKNFNNGAAG